MRTIRPWIGLGEIADLVEQERALPLARASTLAGPVHWHQIAGATTTKGSVRRSEKS
jgi:hypothetical protein